MPNTFWIYFVSKGELVEIYKCAGGTRGTFNKDRPHDVNIATHAVFLYLMPARIQVWFGSLDGVYGMAFIIGRANDALNQAMTREAAERCDYLFGCAPYQWTEIEGPKPWVCSLEKEGKTHTLSLFLFRESDRFPRDYPPEKEA